MQSHPTNPTRRRIWGSIASAAIMAGTVAVFALPTSAAGTFTVSSSASPTTFIKAGDKITFSVTVTNTGDVKINDAKPTGGKCSPTGSSSVDAGSSQVYTCDYSVTQAEVDAGKVDSTATVAPSTGNGGSKVWLTSQTTTATATSVQTPGISVSVAASPTAVDTAGSTVNYTVTATNSGNVTLTSVTPNRDAKCSLTPASVATLAPGASTNFSCSYTVAPGDLSKDFSRTFEVSGSPPKGAAVSGSGSATVTVPKPADPLVISGSQPDGSLPDGVEGEPYSATVTASGGKAPYKSWSVSPAWLSISGSGASATLSGTPPSASNGLDVTVSVTDNNNTVKSQVFTIKIARGAAPVSLTGSEADGSLPDGTAGEAYSATVTATGGKAPYKSWTVSPAWLSISGSGASATLSGTPPSASNGLDVTVSVTDNNNTVKSQVFTIKIARAADPLVLAGSLPDGIVGESYSASVTASGGKAPYKSWAVSPAWLSISGSGASATLSGIPDTADNSLAVTVSVTDNNNTVKSQTFTISIARAPAGSPPAITTTELPLATNGLSYSGSLSSAGGTGSKTWSMISGPDWLTVGSSGDLSGTPEMANAFATSDGETVSVTVQVTDNKGLSDTETFTISIARVPLQVTTASLPPAVSGEPYDESLSAQGGVNAAARSLVIMGSSPYTWRIVSGGPLPFPMIFDNGRIHGTPTDWHWTEIVVEVSDAEGRTATKTFTFSSDATLKSGHEGSTWSDFSSRGDCPTSPQGYDFGWHFVLQGADTEFVSLTAVFATGSGNVTVTDAVVGATKMVFQSIKGDLYKHAYVYTAGRYTLVSATAVVSGPDKDFNLSHVCGPVETEESTTTTTEVEEETTTTTTIGSTATTAGPTVTTSAPTTVPATTVPATTVPPTTKPPKREIDVTLDIQNTGINGDTGEATWDVTVGNNSDLPTPGPVEVVINLPPGSRLDNDPCAGVGSGATSWTCRVEDGRLIMTRKAGLQPGEVVTFNVVTVGGDLSNLVMSGSVAVDGDTVEGNNTASDSVGIAGPLLPATGWDAQDAMAIAVLMLVIGAVLQSPIRRRRNTID